MRLGLAFIALGVVMIARPPPARADGTPPSLDLRTFHAPTDPISGLYLEPADSPGTAEWSAALWFNYVYRPITLRDPTSGDVQFDVIKHQLTSDVTMSFGIAHRLALGF